MAGAVLVNGQKVEKSGASVDAGASIRLLGAACPYVGRGGVKLAHALQSFHIDPAGACCLDIGASTGGFSDCLLQHGAARVFCLDVGRGQLHGRLRNDPRVVPREGYNARFLQAADFPEVFFRIVVMDVSFISVRLILPRLGPFLSLRGTPEADLIVLVKPQFEAGRSDVGKGGIVRDEEVRMRVLRGILDFSESIGLAVVGSTPSPISGADGNVEFLAHLRYARGGS